MMNVNAYTHGLLFLFVCNVCRPDAVATLLTGKTATLSASADGTKPLNFQWRCNGIPIDGATASNYQTNTPGRYDCVISNTAGMVTTDTAILTPMATLSTSVSSDGYPAPAIYQWRKDGKSIPGANQPTYSFDPITSPGSYSLTITWPNVTP
jgi:hypothetical protein